MKVGITSSDPTLRMRNLQTGNHCKLSLYGIIPTEDPSYEWEIHGLLSEYRGIGEWFRFTKESKALIDELLLNKHISKKKNEFYTLNDCMKEYNLKVKDVARRLNKSETTIRKMITRYGSSRKLSLDLEAELTNSEVWLIDKSDKVLISILRIIAEYSSNNKRLHSILALLHIMPE